MNILALARPLRCALLIAPALLVCACGGTVNKGVESVHQPVVQRNNYALDLATAGYALAPGEGKRLAVWLGTLRLSFGDRVTIDDPAASSEAAAEIATEVARHGLLLGEQPPVTAGQITPGTLRVVVTRMTASVPGCPDHSRMNGPTAQTSSNYGCAINTNLAAMVANPEDLVLGQPGDDLSDPSVGTKAIDQFRKAPPTGAQGLPSDNRVQGGGSN